jgi:hypothetical protein
MCLEISCECAKSLGVDIWLLRDVQMLKVCRMSGFCLLHDAHLFFNFRELHSCVMRDAQD